MHRRTLSRVPWNPIRRWEFLAGKFAGLLLTLLVNTALMTLGLAAALLYVKHSFAAADVTILVAVYFILLKLSLITALALFFSCFSSPLLSILFTAGIYVAGLFASDIRTFVHITGSRALDAVAVALSYLIPNLNNFSITASAAYGRTVPSKLI